MWFLRRSYFQVEGYNARIQNINDAKCARVSVGAAEVRLCGTQGEQV